jgi:dolichol-phosphate mannosyltransferase
MDADFSHNPCDVVRLLKACRDGVDVAIGSRYVKGGKIRGWPLKRWLLSRGANLLAQLLLRCRIADMTAGFKCFRRKALEKIDLSSISSEGYVFQVEMNYRAKCRKLNIKQYPICFTDRQYGTSKMGFKEAREGLSYLLNILF